MGQPDYSKMSHMDLLSLRASLPDNDPRQAEIAPMEHRAFAREWAQTSPVLAGIGLPLMIPAYSAAKATGLMSARTKPSLNQMSEGYKGMWEGLGSWFGQ